jgi:hypothetical protein
MSGGSESMASTAVRHESTSSIEWWQWVAFVPLLGCPYCIDAYTQACLEKGSNLEEMTEAVHVARKYIAVM